MATQRIVGLSLLLGMLLGSGHAMALEDETLAQIKADTERLNAEKALAQARYGAAIEGKSGDVAGAGSLSGIVQQQAFALSAKTSGSLATKLSEIDHEVCESLVLTESADSTGRLLKAQSFKKKLQELDAKLPASRNPQSGIALVAAVAGFLGTANQVYGLVRSDYAISDLSVTYDSNWIIGSVLSSYHCSVGDACPSFRADVFPNLEDIRNWIAKLDDLKDRAELVQKGVNAETKGKNDDASKAAREAAKALVEVVAAFRTSLVEPAANGISPIATIGTYVVPAGNDQATCLARLIIGTSKGTFVTKDGLFGKGARVYAHLAMQLAAIVTGPDGKPIKMICKQVAFADAVKVSALTKVSEKYATPTWQGKGRFSDPVDCG